MEMRAWDPASPEGTKFRNVCKSRSRGLREDIDRVELWAGALESFSRPIPDYDPSRRYRLCSGSSVAQDGGDKKNQPIA